MYIHMRVYILCNTTFEQYDYNTEHYQLHTVQLMSKFTKNAINASCLKKICR